MKVQIGSYHSDIILSVMVLFIVGGLVYTGLNALKDGSEAVLQREGLGLVCNDGHSRH